jgi:G3E family GTPase
MPTALKDIRPAHLILVGGFLGAGKTTLLLAAGAWLRASGVRVGVITNDQGSELVDTRLVAAAGLETEEIAGGCFCCRFSEFLRSAERLLARAPQVILAEPVGSCTDLSATVVQPILRFYPDRFRLAPLTVLVDPIRARELLRPDADPHMAYLFRMQLAEADTV